MFRPFAFLLRDACTKKPLIDMGYDYMLTCWGRGTCSNFDTIQTFQTRANAIFGTRFVEADFGNLALFDQLGAVWSENLGRYASLGRQTPFLEHTGSESTQNRPKAGPSLGAQVDP